MATKNARILANLRQICSLNLEWETLLPRFIQALHAGIYFNNSLFLWLSTKTPIITNAWMDVTPPEIIAKDFFSHFAHHECESPHRNGIRSFYARGASVRLAPDWLEFDKTEMFNYIWKGMDINHGISTVIPAADGSRLGHLMLHRDSTARQFSAGDVAFMESLIPYISHALCAKPVSEMEFSDTIDSGLVLLDKSGKIQFKSASALQLALMVSPEGFGGTSPTDSMLDGFSRFVLTRLINLSENRVSAPPRIQLVNRWGRIDMHAYWLDPTAPGEGLVAVKIKRKEPKVLRLTHAMQSAEFSSNQQRAGMLLLQGRTNQEIADAMNIKINSAKDYVKAIFNKANVNSRKDLEAILLSAT